MIYNLKTNNYKTFEIYKENVLEPRSYFIPFENKDDMLATDIRTERYNSSMVAVLSGEWKFKYYSNCHQIPDSFDTDNEEMDDISVPSVWQFTGYENPYYVNTRYQFDPNPPYIPNDCPAGVYSKRFSIGKADGNFNLVFLGVAGSLDVFVNGKYAGYSEGSHNTSEFEITSFLQEGENEVVAVVHKWCNGTYLECQDMFRNNGIFRDVLMIRTTDNSIYDFEAKTTFNNDGSYMLDVIPSFKIKDEVSFNAELFDGDDLIASKSVNICPEKVDKITFDVLDVEEWSAEIPKLYNLYLSLSKEGKIIEIIRKRIGFKHIEIKKNVFYFNNKRIKLLGVNHHDTNESAGYVMTAADMEKDVKTFKEYNINCVRTSHYPPDAMFLDLCDEYGIYVVDEADIETHGCETELHKRWICSHNPKWQGHYWDRVYRMYQRDKNHPSITMWSLGNESHGYKNQDYCYNELKKLSPIPIHYEAVIRTRRWAYDVISEMYAHPNRVDKIANGSGERRKYYGKPYYLCEYAHAMGFGAGELERYVQAFYRGDNMLGGCIWEFADHAVLEKEGSYKYTYGGDHNEWKHDSNFCVDGLFYPDRTPHTGAIQMKNCYRPVRAKKISENEYEFFNHGYFKNADYTVKYRVLNNGETVADDEFKISVEPQRSVKQKLDVKINNHTVIIFEYYNGDFEVAREQIILNSKYSVKPTEKSDFIIKAENSENKLAVTFEKGELIYNKITGEFESYIYNGIQFVNSIPLSQSKGFAPSLYRAPLDNDMNLRKGWENRGLHNLVYTNKTAAQNSYKIENNTVIINSDYKLSTSALNNAGRFSVQYVVHANGRIDVDYKFKKLKFISVPRLGMHIEMPKAFSNISYFGYDMESVSDFKEQAVYGIQNLKVSDMHQKYIKPQESGMRYGTYWARITDNNGTGFEFESKNSFIFNANHFNTAQCAKAAHAEDLKEYDTTDIHIDGYMLGAGSNSCGPVPTGKHNKMNVLNYENSFSVTPVGD